MNINRKKADIIQKYKIQIKAFQLIKIVPQKPTTKQNTNATLQTDFSVHKQSFWVIKNNFESKIQKLTREIKKKKKGGT